MGSKRFPIGRWVEIMWPWAVALLAGWGAYELQLNLTAQKFDNLLTSTISVTAILMGFLGTSKAMLLSLRTRRYDWMKKNPTVWRLTLSYFRMALFSNFALCLLALIALAVGSETLESHGVLLSIQTSKLVLPTWIFLVTLSVTAFYRVLRILFVLLEDRD